MIHYFSLTENVFSVCCKCDHSDEIKLLIIQNSCNIFKTRISAFLIYFAST